MTNIPLTGLGNIGVIRDLPAHLLPPEAFTLAQNVTFTKRGIERMRGHSQVFGTLSVVPEMLKNVPSAQGSFWLYPSLTKVYVYSEGVHTNITRQTTGVDVDYTVANGRDWNGTFIGGIPILNNGVDLPQYWTGIGAGNKLANLTAWTSTNRAKVFRGFGSYLVALNLTDNGVSRPHALRWSHKAGPGTLPSSWDVADPAVDARETELTDVGGGEILEGVLLGQYLIIYKSNATHQMRFVGGADIMGFDLLLSTSGILAARCATAFKKGTRHFVVTEDDVIVHAGTRDAESVIEDRNRSFLFSDIDATNYANTFVFDNVKQKQCWICYPENGQEYPTKAAIWNYKDNTWTFRDFDGVFAEAGPITDAPTTVWDDASGVWDASTAQWSTSSRNDLVYVKRSTTGAFKLDSGYAFASATPTAVVERTGLAIDGVDRNRKPIVDFNTRKLCTRIWPKVEGSALLTVRVGSQQLREDPVVWAAPQTFNPVTQAYLDFTVSGRLLAYRIEWTSNEPVTIEGVDFEIVKTGGL
jgi:hypothetical protein